MSKRKNPTDSHKVTSGSNERRSRNKSGVGQYCSWRDNAETKNSVPSRMSKFSKYNSGLNLENEGSQLVIIYGEDNV